MKRFAVVLICPLLLVGCGIEPLTADLPSASQFPAHQAAEEHLTRQVSVFPSDSVTNLDEEYVMVCYTIDDPELIAAMAESGAIDIEKDDVLPSSVGVTTYNDIGTQPFTLKIIDEYFTTSIFSDGCLTRSCTIDNQAVIAALMDSGEIHRKGGGNFLPLSITLEYRTIVES